MYFMKRNQEDEEPSSQLSKKTVRHHPSAINDQSTMEPDLNPVKLRCSTPREMTEYLRTSLRNLSEEQITDQLLRLVECDSIAPFPVFQPWLILSSSPVTFKKCLQQRISLVIRNFAIIYLGKALRSPKWKTFWNGLGGVLGLVTLFSDFSEKEVKSACRAIAFSCKKDDLEEKRECIAELYKALQGQSASTEYQTQDRRPLQKYYRILAPAFIEVDAESAIDFFDRREKRLFFKCRHTAIEEKFLEHLAKDNTASNHWLVSLLPQYLSHISSNYWDLTKPDLFPMRVLKAITKMENTVLDYNDFLRKLAYPLLTRALRQDVTYELKLSIVEMSIRFLKQNRLLSMLDYKPKSFIALVAKCWLRKPELFADALKRIAVGTTEGLDQLFNNLRSIHGRDVSLDQPYRILQFFCTSLGYNLDNPEHMRDVFRRMDGDMISRLDPHDSFTLFNHLRAANYDNVANTTGSNASPIWSRWRFTRIPYTEFSSGPDLWQVILLQRSGRQKDAEELAMVNIKERRECALRSADPNLRGQHIGSVLAYSAASGSLEMYKQQQIWARRFLRDPLVAMKLWRSACMRDMRLLSGIPGKHLLQSDASVGDIDQNIVAANKIIAELFETVEMAKSEPFFERDFYQGTYCSLCIRISCASSWF